MSKLEYVETGLSMFLNILCITALVFIILFYFSKGKEERYIHMLFYITSQMSGELHTVEFNSKESCDKYDAMLKEKASPIIANSSCYKV